MWISWINRRCSIGKINVEKENNKRTTEIIASAGLIKQNSYFYSMSLNTNASSFQNTFFILTKLWPLFKFVLVNEMASVFSFGLSNFSHQLTRPILLVAYISCVRNLKSVLIGIPFKILLVFCSNIFTVLLKKLNYTQNIFVDTKYYFLFISFKYSFRI